MFSDLCHWRSIERWATANTLSPFWVRERSTSLKFTGTKLMWKHDVWYSLHCIFQYLFQACRDLWLFQELPSHTHLATVGCPVSLLAHTFAKMLIFSSHYCIASHIACTSHTWSSEEKGNCFMMPTSIPTWSLVGGGFTTAWTKRSNFVGSLSGS